MAPAVTRPTPCDVMVNMYKYTGRELVLHVYDVTVDPVIHRDALFSRFMRIAESQGFKENFAFDGVAALVSDKKFANVEFRVPFREDEEQTVKIEYKNTYDMSDPCVNPSMLIQAMEVIARFHQKIAFYVEKKRMISQDARPFDLGAGLEVMPGLVSVFKQTRLGFCINLDVAFGIFFRPGSLLDLVREISERRGRRYGSDSLPECGSDFYSDLEKFVRNVRMVTTHREKNTPFRASGICNKAAYSVEFEVDGKNKTVAEYFAETYGPLKYPHLPLVVVKKRDMTIYMPMEVLEIMPMQRYPRKMDEAMTAQMIRIAAQRPAERFRNIREKAQELAALANPCLERFGMAFDNSMVNCKGIMLPPPKIVFSGGEDMKVNNGSWNLIGVRALSGISIKSWKIFVFRAGHQIPADTLRNFTDLAGRYGVSFPGVPETVVLRSITDFFDASKAEFNLVILPDKNSQRYEEIKRIAETYHKCYTQCVVGANIGKLSNASFVSNLLLKVNAKLGGKNWSISTGILSDRPTILLGIDVSHPGVSDLENPSIVSVVASMDYNFITYRTAISQQKRREEIVGDLRNILRSMLKAHNIATGSKPERIVVFRDGVGDSMFDAVFSSEIESMRLGCLDLSPAYKPEITFIVAQKRHSVRFSSNGSNLIPGTIVDELAHPSREERGDASTVALNNCVHDFYLVSHNALQGTARPVRYLVLLNESSFSASYLYETVYGLCHLYMRATKSVSVVPPIYYAHLAAARGKCYLERNDEGALYMRKCDAKFEKTLYYL